MGDMEAVGRVISRSEWLVLGLSLLVFVAAALLAAVAHRLLDRKGLRFAAVVAFLLIYLGGVIVYVRVFEHQYVRAWTDLLQAIPGPHGAVGGELAREIAQSRISGWPPRVRLLTYPAWLPLAIPSMLFVLNAVWLFAKRRAA